MATKEEILKTAKKLFAKKGYENTTLEEIAKELNITKPALYYHFKNKQTIYNQIFQEKFKDIEFKDQKDLIKNITFYIETLSNIFLKDPDFARLFSKELANEGMHLTKETLQQTAKTIKFLSNTLKDTNINPFFIQTLIVSSFTTYINTTKLREKIQNLSNINTKSFEIKEEITQIILHYIKAHK
jgi:AcrR family transcriptional regulator